MQAHVGMTVVHDGRNWEVIACTQKYLICVNEQQEQIAFKYAQVSVKVSPPEHITSRSILTSVPQNHAEGTDRFSNLEVSNQSEAGSGS